MTKNTKILMIALTIVIAVGLTVAIINQTPKESGAPLTIPNITTAPLPDKEPHPMAIESLRQVEYLGGQFIIEEEFNNGAEYQQYIASYQSEGLKIYGLLTIPNTPKPDGGYPAIIFIHGYIPPQEYSPTTKYVSYQGVLTRNGFVTFKPDLRGHGQSEGEPVSAHYSEKYVIDTLNALAYLKIHPDVNPNRLGYWGHSNGGEIGLRSMVITQDIKAGVFWAGVVGSFEDMLETYNDKIPFLSNVNDVPLVKQYGLPSANPDFWQQIDPYAYLNDISGPIQMHHGTADNSVPIELSIRLNEELKNLNKPVEYYGYRGDNHDLTNNFDVIWQRTVRFFKENL